MAAIKVTGNAGTDTATSEIAIALRRAYPGSRDQHYYDEAMRLRDAIVATLTDAQQATIAHAVELVVANDTVLGLAEFLQVEPVPDGLYQAAFFHTIKLLDQVVAVVDELTGNDENQPCVNALKVEA